LAAHGYEADRLPDSVAFDDPEGLSHELRVVNVPDEPLVANHPEIPAGLALQGFHAARAYAADPERSRPLLEDTLGFGPAVEVGPGGAILSREVRGERRGGYYLYEPPPQERPLQGAGTVHHIAWSAAPEDLEAWRQRVASSGARPTHVIDRHYFYSVYFREPSGVLFEIATIGPGFTVDEPLEHLGEKLSLTPKYEHLRNQIEPRLTPLRNPRESWASR
ncbi:MAG TPA: VOC family protein, partial [Solirubrobacteraceae bacterium]